MSPSWHHFFAILVLSSQIPNFCIPRCMTFTNHECHAPGDFENVFFLEYMFCTFPIDRTYLFFVLGSISKRALFFFYFQIIFPYSQILYPCHECHAPWDFENVFFLKSVFCPFSIDRTYLHFVLEVMSPSGHHFFVILELFFQIPNSCIPGCVTFMFMMHVHIYGI